MKRKCFILMALLLMLPLTACESHENKQEATTGENESKSELTNAKILIAYFSVPEDVDTSGVDAIAGASVVVKEGEKLGNTEWIAKQIQKNIGGDLFRIETVDAYPIDHRALVNQAAEEQDKDFRPQLATHVEALESYDYILLGYPNWWGDMPQALYSFLEEYDFSGKTVIPFIIHGGSGASDTVNTISQLQPEALMMGNELIISREEVGKSEEIVDDWTQSLGMSDH